MRRNLESYFKNAQDSHLEDSKMQELRPSLAIFKKRRPGVNSWRSSIDSDIVLAFDIGLESTQADLESTLDIEWHQYRSRVGFHTPWIDSLKNDKKVIFYAQCSSRLPNTSMKDKIRSKSKFIGLSRKINKFQIKI